MFRTGAVENVNAGFLLQSDPEQSQHLYHLEILIMDCVERMLKIMDLLDIPGPYYVLIALLNARGLRVSPDRRHALLGSPNVGTIQQNHLILPELLVENTDVAIESAMRSSFDMIWNAAGWERSFSYDENGHHTNENWRTFFD
jgi:hypothetical protein